MADPKAGDQPFRFLDLPKELRLEILGLVVGFCDLEIYFNNLTKKFHVDSEQDHGYEGEGESESGDEHTALNKIEDERWDERSSVDAYGNPRLRFPAALFRVSKCIKDEALNVLFSQNRLCLCCTFERDLQWLMTIPKDLLEKVRKLDLVIHKSEVLFWKYDKSSEHDILPHFKNLVQFIAMNFELSVLFLSLDGQHERRESVVTQGVLANASAIFWLQLCSLGKTHLRPTLKRFHAYCMINSDMEQGLEKRVMGSSFNSFEFGKIPYRLRLLGVPHRLNVEAWVLGNCEVRPFPEDDSKGVLKPRLNDS